MTTKVPVTTLKVGQKVRLLSTGRLWEVHSISENWVVLWNGVDGSYRKERSRKRYIFNRADEEVYLDE